MNASVRDVVVRALDEVVGLESTDDVDLDSNLLDGEQVALDSLSFIEVLKVIEKELDVDVADDLVYEGREPTIRNLIQAVEDSLSPGSR